MWTAQRYATVALALALLTTGCLGAVTGGGDDGGDGPADRIQSRSLEAMQDVGTYRLTMDVAAAGPRDSVTMSVDGAFDREAEKARMEMELRGEEVLVYAEGTTMYLRVDGEWRREEVSREDIWADGSRLEQQRRIMENADPTLVRNTTTDGEEVHVLEMSPSGDQVRKLLTMQGQSLGRADVEDVTVRQYVDQESYRIRRTELSMTLSRGDQTATVDGVITFSDYGSALNVTVPDAATETGSTQSLVAP